MLTHAVAEALLGALALGDLGRLFPDTDPRYLNVSSLESAAERGRGGGGQRRQLPINVDATVICQAPRLAAFLDQMAARLAETLMLAPGRVSVKAKSPEGLGLLGREGRDRSHGGGGRPSAINELGAPVPIRIHNTMTRRKEDFAPRPAVRSACTCAGSRCTTTRISGTRAAPSSST